jgi:hypothetical protein
MEYMLVNLFINGALFLPAMDSIHLFPNQKKKKKKVFANSTNSVIRVPLMQQHKSLNP